MNLGDLATFGADVLPKDTANMGGQFVLTRLHLRYTKESLGDDIAFRTAPPIVGGREVMGADSKLGNGAKPSSFNNFQARYAIRHPWTGPIACKEPRRGIWGGRPGPQGGIEGVPPPRSAQKLGLAPHVKAELASFVKQDVPEIGFVKASAAMAPVMAPPSATPATPATDGGTVATADAKKGCLGCAVTETDSPASAGWLAALGLAVVAARRRRGGRGGRTAGDC
jgi:MYXO-CTERM domain-containing protein